jgi:hypothetical protein
MSPTAKSPLLWGIDALMLSVLFYIYIHIYMKSPKGWCK